MRKTFSILTIFSLVAHAEMKLDELIGPMPETQASSHSRRRSLDVKARLDTEFAAGSPVQQGFSVPSVRLAASGDASENISYRLSLGQTREYSTALLPQIIPVEAIINLHSSADVGEPERVNFRVGMFSPSINPWFTPDLGDLRIPDYNETHKAIFMSKEMGAEVTFRPLIHHLEVSVGAFNGAGIFGLNTNGAKAFNLFTRGVIPIGEVRVLLGSGNYVLNQGATGSVNYKMAWFSDEFIELDLKPIRTDILMDLYFGRFEDAVVAVAPMGGSITVFVDFWDDIGLFVRAEDSRSVPQEPGPLRHYEIGPVLTLAQGVRAYGFFQYLERGNSTQQLFHVRFRLAV